MKWAHVCLKALFRRKYYFGAELTCKKKSRLPNIFRDLTCLLLCVVSFVLFTLLHFEWATGNFQCFVRGRRQRNWNSLDFKQWISVLLWFVHPYMTCKASNSANRFINEWVICLTTGPNGLKGQLHLQFLTLHASDQIWTWGYYASHHGTQVKFFFFL